MGELYCKDCNEMHHTRRQLKRHRADFHQLKLEIPGTSVNQSLEIFRDRSGAWVCVCGHKEHGVGCTERMRRHARSCEGPPPAPGGNATEHNADTKGGETVSLPEKGSIQEKTLNSLSMLVGGVLDRLEGSSKSSLDPNRRCVDAFIAKTKWHETIGDVSPELVEAYVSGPTRGKAKESLLYHACHAFLANAEELERSTTFLTLRFLGPQSDGSKPGRDPFRTVQESTTLQRYGDDLGRLLLMVWRRTNSERFNGMSEIPESVSAAIKNFERSVGGKKSCSPSSSIVQKALRLVLKEVFCVNLPASCQRDDQVVAQFVMLRNLSVRRGWAGPEEAGHAVAALLYAVRCTILSLIREERPCDEDAKRLFELLSTDRNTPFCALQDLMRIAAYTKANEWSAGVKVVWSTVHPAWTTLAVGPDLVNLKEFANGLKYLCTEASCILKRDLLLNMELEERAWNDARKNIVENIRETRLGHNLFHKRSNPRISEMGNYLFQHICSSAEIFNQFFSGPHDHGGDIPPWNEKRLQTWCAKAHSFVDHLIPLIHILGGGPARAEELATVAIMNTATSMRNLYWMNNAVMLVTRYHKSQSVIGRGRPVARFLPDLISDLVLKYVALVKPFEAVAAGVLYGGKSAEEAHRVYLFSRRGKRMSGPMICSSFSLSMHKVVDFGLKISDYRHLYTTIAKKYLGSLDQEALGLPFHEQAAHSSETGEYRYGITNFDHHQITTNGMLMFWRCSNEWQALFDFAESQRDWDEPPKLGKRMRDKTVPETAGCQGLHSSLRFRATQHSEMAEILREWSQAQGSADPVSIGYESSTKSRRQLSRSCLGPAESGKLLVSLRRFLENPNAFFLSKSQIQATREVLRGKEDLLIVMPTGSGKSLTYLLPVWLESSGTGGNGVARTTIVVVPLVALVKDIRRRCESRGICVGEWEERDQYPAILLVSVEVTESEYFLSYIGRLAALGGLARIVVEEAHLRITWERFRPKLRALGLMRPATGVPLVLVTGTLPPCLEPELAVKFGSPFSTIRMATSRPNLSYRVIHLDTDVSGKNEDPYANSHVYAGVVRVLRTHEAVLKEESSRAIIYCPTRGECNRMLQRLQLSHFSVSCYHRGLESAEREASDEAWRSGRAKVMVATSAFGTGIDFAGVRLVLHVGHSSSILDYAQETGRAGRDGRLAYCVTLAHRQYSLSLLKYIKDPVDVDKSCVLEMEEECLSLYKGSEQEETYRNGLFEFLSFIARLKDQKEPKRCRRQELQIYLDGEGDNCLSCGAECAPCDVCEAICSAGGSTAVHENIVSVRQIRFEKTDVSQLSLSEDPSGKVRETGRAAQKQRSRIQEAFEKACLTARTLSDFCVLCSVIRGKLLQHQTARGCEEGRRRCLRCYRTDHGAKTCPLPPIRRVLGGKPSCFSCGLAHRGSQWGSRCTTGLRHARSALLAVWQWKKNWLMQNFEQSKNLKSLEEYDRWLYQEVGEYEPLRIIQVFNKWWMAYQFNID